MDYDQMALFLSSCTTPGFRRSLTTLPHDTLQRVGFQGAEIGRLTGSLTKMRGQASAPGSAREFTAIGFTFNKIELGTKLGKKAFSDDWYA